MIPPDGIIKGHPADDPTANLWCYETLPDASVFPPPWRGILFLPPGVYRSANPGLCLVAARDLAARGFMCWSCSFRAIVDQIDGQTTDGRDAQPLTDMRVFLSVMRADPRLLASHPYAVGAIGGSSGGHFAWNLGFIGTPDQRVDWVVTLSGAVNCAERRPETYLFNGQDPVTRAAVFWRDYCGTGAALPDDSAPNLAIMLAKSPITLRDNSIDCPIQIYCTEFDPMPFHQHTDGIENLTAHPPTYWSHRFTPGSDLHAFKAWDLHKDGVFPFADDPTSIGSGGEPPPPPPPPPDQEPTGYKIRLVSARNLDDTPNMTADATFPEAMNGILTVDKVATTIVVTEPDVKYRFGLTPFNAFGDGPESLADAQSPPFSASVLKSQPRGSYSLVPASGGVWGDISGRAFWGLAYIAGVRVRPWWKSIEPTKGNFDLSIITDPDPTRGVIALAQSKGKKFSLSVSCGIFTPDDVYDVDGATRFHITLPETGDQPFTWDPIFLARHRAMALYTGSQLDSVPELSYLVLGGMGQITETYFVKDGGEFSIANARAIADGFVEVKDAWVFGAKQVIQNWIDGWPTTRFLISLGLPFPTNVGGSAAITEITSWCIDTFPAGKIGFMQAGLNPASNDGFILNAIVKQYSPVAPAGFQHSHPSGGDATEFNGTLDAQVALLGKFEELYPNDAENAPYATKITDTNTAMALFP